MCIYIYIYIHIHMCIYIYMYIYIYIYIHVCVAWHVSYHIAYFSRTATGYLKHFLSGAVLVSKNNPKP